MHTTCCLHSTHRPPFPPPRVRSRPTPSKLPTLLATPSTASSHPPTSARHPSRPRPRPRPRPRACCAVAALGALASVGYIALLAGSVEQVRPGGAQTAGLPLLSPRFLAVCSTSSHSRSNSSKSKCTRSASCPRASSPYEALVVIAAATPIDVAVVIALPAPPRCMVPGEGASVLGEGEGERQGEEHVRGG